MAKKKQLTVVKPRASTRGFADFDEQLWPVNLLLVLFAVCVAAVIVAKSDFVSPRLLNNGWLHLGTLAAIVAGLAWGVTRLDRRIQRRTQLGVFLSLLVHLWLCLLSYNIYLSAVARREDDAPEAFEEPAPVTLPDYHWHDEANDDATDPTLTMPVETPLEETQSEVDRQEVEKPLERLVESEPEIRPPDPTPPEIQRKELSAPRRAPELSGERPSRQERRLAATSEQVALPEVPEARQQTLESPLHLERSEPRPVAGRPSMETTLPASQPAAQSLARRTPTETTAESAPARLARKQSTATAVATQELTPIRITEVPRPAPIEAAASTAEHGDHAARAVRRILPVHEAPSVMATVPANRAAQHNAADSPQVDTLSPTRLAKAASKAGASQSNVPAPKPAQAEAGDMALPETHLTSVERAATSLPDRAPMTTTSSTSADSPATTTANAVATTRPDMASESPAVSAISTAKPDAPRRLATASSDHSEAAEATPGAMRAPADALSDPSLPALSKASGGVAGLTRQTNFDTELPSMATASVAVSAARRPESLQAMDAGPAAAPSEPAKVARSRASAEAPAASMPTEAIAVADMAGAARPVDLDSSSSAAVERRAAALPRTNRTAAAASGSIDQGLPQMSSPIGERRASGGGEPSLSTNETSLKLAKATPRAAASGIRSTAPASAPSAAAANDDPQPESSAAAPTRLAAALPAFRQTVNTDAATGGPAGPSPANAPLARREEAAPDLPGGTFLPSPRSRTLAEAVASDGTSDDMPLPPAGGAPFPAGGDRQDNEPPSASDLAHHSPAGLPAGALPGSSSGAALAPSTVGAGPTLRPRSDDVPSITMGITTGTARRPAVAAQASGAADAPDDAPVPVPAAAGGEETALADLGNERQAAALPVLTRAPSGTGGLGPAPSFDLGVPDRLARPETDVAHMNSERFLLKRGGVSRAAELRVQDVAVPGYRQRDRQLRQQLARQRGGSEGSERAVEMGLDFLARHQNVDGSWSLQMFSQGRPGYESAGDGQMVSDTAATGLAMLAFLGAGYTHTDGKYRLVVTRGLNYLLGNQRADGDLFLPQDAQSNLNVWLYSHGIASIALCEAYGMTRDPTLKQPAQLALDFIVASQHPVEGGWRYVPRQGSDTSVSGWQLMALKSGELAGLRVPATAYTKVSQWLDAAQAPGDSAKYVYRPKSSKSHQNSASRVMTAEALLMRQYSGWKREHRLMTAGADYLMTQLPDWSIRPEWQRDSYYWYYATQVMFQMGGVHWDAWNERLRPLLVEHQVQEGPLAGSWEPLGEVPDRWGREGGRIYVTAMHLLMLEVYYRHLPLYRTLDE